MKIKKKGKRLFAVLISIAMIITTMPFGIVTANAVTTQFAGGSGTEADPYLIETKEHLNNVRNDLDAHYKMIADIEFSATDFAVGGDFYNNGNGWKAIITTSGSYYWSFTGTFDGNGHYIEGLTIYGDSSNLGYIGLFGDVSGEVRDLEMRSVVISLQTNRHTFVGCLTGSASNATISNCKIQGKITVETSPTYETTYVGGICGYMSWSNFVNCTNKVDITCDGAFDCVGGICGAVQEGYINQSVNYGKLEGTHNVGGISGDIVETTISTCANFGDVQATGFSSELANYSIAGYDGMAGGIVAISNSDTQVNNCFNNGKITSDGTVGGIVGNAGAVSVNNSYNTGSISADIQGGIIGWTTNASFENCYFIDSVSNAIGYGSSTGSSTKCTAQELKDKETFAGFDFNTIWEFAEGNYYKYPTLRGVDCFIVNENATFNGGSGTENDPYLIKTAEQLNRVRNYQNAYFKMISDITFTDADFEEGGSFYNNGQGWIPIGENKTNSFSGVFDGNGFNIENLYINLSLTSDAYIGLFGYSKGEINNLEVIATNYVVDVSNKNASVGGVVGYSESNISNCSVEGKINVESTSSIANEVIAGGIVGTLGADKLITINSCFNDCDITVIRNITSTATSGGVATTSAGGVIGKTTSDTTILNCNNAGNIYTTYNGGQLVDIVSGGILGKSWFNTSVLDSCYNCGNITAYSPDAENTINNHAGGIVGDAYSLNITKCYNTGNISSNHNSGGIFANTTSSVESEITDCFNVGNISSGFSSGGIGGSTEATITNCYNVGFVEGKIYGGIIGFNNGGNATVTNCFYWDIVDKGVGNWDDNAAKCSLSELKKSDTYQGFDFENDWSRSSSLNYAFPVLQGTSFVFEKELSAIKIKTLPTKLKYLEAKDPLNVSGGEIDLFYNNGDVDSVSLTNNMITGFNNSKVGMQTLTVTYEGKTCNYDVEVIAKSLVSIAVTTKPSKLSYLEGENFETAGLVVKAYYNNDTSSVVNDYTISGYSSSVGTKTITISYGGKTTTFTVTVNSRVPATVTSSKHTINGNNISKITAGTTVSSLLSGLNEGSYCKVYKGGSEVSGSTAVGTGMVVKIMDGNTVKVSYTVIVTGDTNGDGAISVTDMIAIKAHILNKSTLTGVYATAANTNGDSGISITDFIQVKAKILGKGNIIAR